MSESTPFTYVLDGGLRILAVDDDAIQREFSVVYLAAPGVEVITASSGEAAISFLENEHFDIALVDYEMPGMTGIDLVQYIRGHDRLSNLPIIMITGREDIASIDAAFKAGATSFMCKPVNWRLLTYQIRFVLRAQAFIARA
ncbi:MAG: response regulator [Beijerinckiaceae bacterium]|nr:response regulator [Beijerinckiaceae bacterium]